MESETATGTLYLCATPIGNLQDVTLRVLDILGSVDLVAAEDTRRTRRLFERHGIRKPMVSYREENRERAGRRIIDRMNSGENVALVSDAGTPGISDPGYHLVQMCIAEDIPVQVVPGPSAAVSALVVSGLPTRRFAFEGFLPRKKGARRKALKSLAEDSRTLIFYESPNRVAETLVDIEDVLGDRRIAVARELTKKFEQVLRGRVSELREDVGGFPAKGEFVLVVEGCTEDHRPSLEEAVGRVRTLQDKGLSLKEAVNFVAVPGSGISRSELYNLALKRRG